MGFGKGSDPAPPAPYMPPADSGEGMDDAMGAMMSMMMMQQSMANSQPQMPSLPEIYDTPEIDWTEQNASLAQKAKADASLDAARRKGRMDTVLTSPLADGEDTSVSGSLLTGN